MAKSKLKEKMRRLILKLKKNALYLITLLFLVFINIVMISYHRYVGNMWIVLIHVALGLPTFIIAVYLNNFSHRKGSGRRRRDNRIYNVKALGDTIDMRNGEGEVCSRNEDPDTPNTNKSVFTPPIFRPKVRRARKRLVYFTVDTSLINVKWCSTCQNYRSPVTLHCGNCETCVHNFDHHCIWLNNCISKNNYSAFVVYVVLMLGNCYFGVFSVVDLFFISRRINKIHIGIFFGILALVIILGAVFTTILVGFHLYLKKKRLSTYQFVRLKFADKPTNNTIFYSERRITKNG